MVRPRSIPATSCPRLRRTRAATRNAAGTTASDAHISTETQVAVESPVAM